MAASPDLSRRPPSAATDGSPEPEGFAIRLPSAQLADLIQLNCLNRVRGAFKVSSGLHTGHLFFENGQLIHADCDQHIGLDAVVKMLGWRGGSIEPCQQPWPRESSIDMGADALLLHAAQRIDEQSPAYRAREDVTTKVVRKVPWPEDVTPVPGVDATIAEAERPSQTFGPDSSGVVPLSRASWAPSREQLAQLEVVRINPRGNIEKLRTGASTELADTSYFCQHVGNLIGQMLELGDCRAVSLESPSEGIVVFKGRSIVGTRGKNDDLGFILERVGLK